MHSWVKTIYPGLMKCKQCHCLRAEIDGEFKPRIHFERLSEEVYAYSHNGYWSHRPNLQVKFAIDWVPKHASCVARRAELDGYAGPDPSIPEIREVAIAINWPIVETESPRIIDSEDEAYALGG